MTRIASQNLRYILWKKEKINREGWIDELILLLKCDKVRAKQLLLTEFPSESEVAEIANNLGISSDEIKINLFLEDQIVILKENLEYLFESIEQKQLAKEIGVSKDAVSKWKLGKQKISKKNLTNIHRYFRLPSDVNLEDDPVFLSWTPIDDKRRRFWLHQQIEEMDSDTLRDLFPTFERLFGK